MQVMVLYARLMLSQGLQTARKLHQKLGAAASGAMWTLANAMVRQTLGFQTTSLQQWTANHCITPMQHVAMLMHTLQQNVLRSQPLPHALPRMNVLGQPQHPHVVRTVPQSSTLAQQWDVGHSQVRLTVLALVLMVRPLWMARSSQTRLASPVTNTALITVISVHLMVSQDQMHATVTILQVGARTLGATLTLAAAMIQVWVSQTTSPAHQAESLCTIHTPPVVVRMVTIVQNAQPSRPKLLAALPTIALGLEVHVQYQPLA